jgi:hypothetical protein
MHTNHRCSICKAIRSQKMRAMVWALVIASAGLTACAGSSGSFVPQTPAISQQPNGVASNRLSGAYQPLSGAYQPLSGAYQPLSGAYQPLSGAYQPL